MDKHGKIIKLLYNNLTNDSRIKKIDYMKVGRY